MQALKELPDWKLTIVGSRNVFQDQVKKTVKKMGIKKQVIFTGYLSDKELAKEIKSSSALVQPSLSEGFGLTGIESMSLGTPVLASDIPVFKEIYQDAVIYFDPYSVESFNKAIKKLSTNKPSSKKMKAVTNTCCWDEMVKKTISVYRSVL